ncbi:U2 small nuclear ribonucleoprotein auxiliary factor 35 kDa subunit-related protein 2-like [Drosophila hydei]|uniref:U2 small nuclear ribonucleoprotein auxiliary factor 35 kDa subunit-related protein 2-like n=1 Tax=Drosophila hydei TaxID=7224 RepID=A0A6J1M7V1_DROHY|nr:U2 small nuclear ribonucleoprotein auxiliary factor 35 kDa subunit-related protein 2-like [Drosophila hydei]
MNVVQLTIFFTPLVDCLQGLSLTRKCPKGYSCGYLHLFRNPNNLFNSSLELYDTPKSVRSGSRTPTSRKNSWHDNGQESRNWRWSESPEMELKLDKSSTNHSKRHQSNDRDIKRDSGRHSSEESGPRGSVDSARYQTRDSRYSRATRLHSSQDHGHHSRSRSRNRSTSSRKHVSKADYSRSRTPPSRRVK